LDPNTCYILFRYYKSICVAPLYYSYNDCSNFLFTLRHSELGAVKCMGSRSHAKGAASQWWCKQYTPSITVQ